jgi:arsenite methyltransferase
MENVQTLDTADLEARVKSVYRDVAEEPDGHFHFETGRALAERLGYSTSELDRIPAEAVDSFAGVGCFFDLMEVRAGETVLDLGSGSGTDAFIAGLRVGEGGSVIGVDMTDAQLEKATRLARENQVRNVEFRKGYIEAPPIDDASVDVVISNGVINLSPDKAKVFAAAAAALREGGRLAIADIVSDTQLPETITCDASLWAACIGGAMQREDYRALIESTGLEIETIRENAGYRFVSDRAKNATQKYGVRSVSIVALKRSS